MLALLRTILVAVAVAIPAVAGAVDTERLPVPAITIYPGDIISDKMLTAGQFPAGTAQGLAVAASNDELVGKVARRTLLPGKLISRTSYSEPVLVQKGAIISAEFRQGALIITASVLALQSGAVNDVIQVRNIDSGKTIVGAVQANGTVRIGG